MLRQHQSYSYKSVNVRASLGVLIHTCYLMRTLLSLFLIKLTFFLTTNRIPGISASLLWETLKAYIRGEIILYSSNVNKQRKTKIKELRLRISQLDNIYASFPSPNIYKDHLSLQAEFDVLSTKEVRRSEELLFQAKYCYYESGDKATKLLAHQHQQASLKLVRIDADNAEQLEGPITIDDLNNIFYAVWKMSRPGRFFDQVLQDLF